jgi:predicted Zn-dependent peptidase
MRAPFFVTFVACVITSASFAQGVTLPVAQRVELENGLVLVLHEKHEVPLVGVQVMLRGGAAADPDGKAGLAELFAILLEKGAGERDAAAFADAVASVGGSLSARAGLEDITISGEFLARDTALMVELIADMLQRPRLDSAELEKLRDRRIALLRAAKDNDIGRLISAYGTAFLFDVHPYGAPVGGDETSLARVTPRDMLAYYDDAVGADRTVIAVVGDFDAGAMTALITEAFQSWRRAGSPVAAVPAAAPQDERRVLLVDKPGATQSYFWIGNVGVGRDYTRRAELDIANTLFGGRFTSMLVDELRIKAGLTYSASSSLLRPTMPGSVAIISFTKTESTVVAIDLALELLTRLHTAGFDADQIASGKNYILGQFPPRLETAARLAAQYAALEAYGLDDSWVNDYTGNVSRASEEAIRAVINDVYPTPDSLVFVIIGDAETIRDDIGKYGAVTEMPITAPSFSPTK